MEKFHNLPLEKQNTIIDAALSSFGMNGYKKTSVSDIAVAAGISKAMVFHYFNTKKDFYFYLFNYCSNLIMDEINDKFDTQVTDFFERIKISSDIKVAVLKKHPAALSYLNSVYYEDNIEVKSGIDDLMSKSDAFRNKIVFEGMDLSKFKDNVDVNLVMKMLMWITVGFINPSKSLQESDLENICNELYACLDLLKSNFYKEEYL